MRYGILLASLLAILVAASSYVLQVQVKHVQVQADKSTKILRVQTEGLTRTFENLSAAVSAYNESVGGFIKATKERIHRSDEKTERDDGG